MNRSLRLRHVALAGAVFAVVGCTAHAGSFSPTASSSYRGATSNVLSGDLLYAGDPAGLSVLVFSYPQGSLVQTLTGFAAPPFYMCSDRRGDVFVPTTNFSSPGYIYEFAHGGTQPIDILTDPGPGYARGCSVDPATGNLAVANQKDVAIYPNAQGNPTVYPATDVGAWDCAYDDSGDLFVDGAYYGNKIAELPAGGTSFADIGLSKTIRTGHLQWWHRHLVLFGGWKSEHGPYELFQVRISGSSGIVTGPTLLYGESTRRALSGVEFTLSSGTIVMPKGAGDSLLDLWHFPKGGKSYEVIGRHDGDFYGVALSK